MTPLYPAQRRALRAQAHHLQPVVSIGNAGLTETVLHEIDVNLLAHELIKIRVLGDERPARDMLLALICAELRAQPVQHIGKLLVIYRPAPNQAIEEQKTLRKATLRQAPRSSASPLPCQLNHQASPAPPGGSMRRRRGH